MVIIMTPMQVAPATAFGMRPRPAAPFGVLAPTSASGLGTGLSAAAFAGAGHTPRTTGQKTARSTDVQGNRPRGPAPV